jgi:hypothetical protein
MERTRQEEARQPHCVRCLLLEQSQGDILKKIRQLIDLMPEKEKTSGELYEQRLEICKKCDELLDGMCKKCGCYVQLRAAKCSNKCPSETHLW